MFTTGHTLWLICRTGKAGRAKMEQAEKRRDRVAWICAIAAFITSGVVAAAALSAVENKPSGLVRMPDVEPIAQYARKVDPGFRFISIDGRYDGRYFWTIAADPFAHGEAHELIDQNAYRYGHPGFGWLAGVLSFGHEPFIPVALLFLNLALMATAGGLLSLYSSWLGATPWLGLAVAFNPGLLYAVSVDTSEPLVLTLVILALMAWHSERWVWALVAILALCLTKEPYVLVPIGLGIYELFRWIKFGRPKDLWIKVLALSVGPIALALWYAYVTNTFDVWPLDQTDENLVLPPLKGVIQTVRDAAEASLGAGDHAQIGGGQLPLLAASAGVAIAGILRALRRVGQISFPFVLVAILVLCLSGNATFFEKDLIRNLSVMLALAPLVAFRPDAGTLGWRSPKTG
jgi:hypothetical protein